MTRVESLELKRKVLHMVNVARDWRNDPDMVFDVLCRAADEWHTVEVVDKVRANLKKPPAVNVDGKSVNGV